ncbi:MAG TPA: FAD:protein FMN transferase, partial [Solirubrobacterales bacterium]|nr:FAD:protein FMN transferase [Solirubrobacterales bacterium]
MNEHDLTFDAMGSHVRLLVGEPGPESALPPASEAAAAARDFVHEFDATLSRFRPESAICALNRDPRDTVPAPPLVRRAVRAGIKAAELSGGLVDPTLVGEIEGAGYVSSR